MARTNQKSPNTRRLDEDVTARGCFERRALEKEREKRMVFEIVAEDLEPLSINRSPSIAASLLPRNSAARGHEQEAIWKVKFESTHRSPTARVLITFDHVA